MTTRKRVMRMAEVQEATGLNKRTLYRYISGGQFPRPFKVGMRASGWWEADVMAWLESRAQGRAAT